MTRVPLLVGTHVVLATAPDDAVILRPPPPGEAIADVSAAVRDALRFPLAGAALEQLAAGATRATLLVEAPALPLPTAPHDPRQAAIAATVAELERLGIPTNAQTIVVAAGLARRPGQRALESLVAPEFARRFHGRVVVHDVEAPDLVELDAPGLRVPLRVQRALVDTDALVLVTAAESVLHGGPATLVAAANADAQRVATATSLVETSGSLGWEVGLALEHALSQRVPTIGVSLVLNHHRLTGALRGYPYEEEAVERLVRSRLRRVFRTLPGAMREHVLRALPVELTAAAAFAGPPSVAHAEALLRAVELRGVSLSEPVDAICVGVPRATPYLPRERPNPLLGAYLGLGLALRLWRDTFPVVQGGTVILVHGFNRHFSHPTQQPYRAFFGATRGGPVPAAIAAAEETAARDPRALKAYRDGRTCHPLLPFRDWEAVQDVTRRLGEVLVAGCRDGTAARQLGFIPVHGIAPALEMAHGWRDRPPRIAFLLAPPYFPLRVG